MKGVHLIHDIKIREDLADSCPGKLRIPYTTIYYIYIYNSPHQEVALNVMSRVVVMPSVLSLLTVLWRGNPSWWRHQMKTFSALLAICAGNSPVTGEFPAQRPVTRSFDVFFGLCLNEWLSKQSWGWWFETPSRPLWRHSNVTHHAYHLWDKLTWDRPVPGLIMDWIHASPSHPRTWYIAL